MKQLGFLSQFLKKENSVGAIAPSSKQLARKLMKMIDFGKAKVVVELGAGTGIITKELLDNLHEDAILYVFETNEDFCRILSKLKDDRLHVVQGSAEHMEEYLPAEVHGKVNVVLSSLPFTILSSGVKDAIMKAVTRMLSPEGVFFQFQYSLQAYRYLKKLFNEVKLDFTAVNLPPAFIYTCRPRS